MAAHPVRKKKISISQVMRKSKATNRNVSVFAARVLKPGSRAGTRTERQAELSKTLQEIARKRKKK